MAVWGLDIGKSALKAVKVRPAGEGIEILAVEHYPYSIEEDEDERQEQQGEALRNFLANNKTIQKDQLVVGLAGLHAFSRFIKLPPVDSAKVDQLVRMEAQQQIPFPIAEVNWDYVRINRDYDEGDEIEVGIFATRSELVEGFLADLKENDARPDIVTIAPLAIYNFARLQFPDQQGASIVLDIGAEHTDLVIVDGERFWIRNLRIAGNDITKALAERFKVPFKQAEKLKRSSAKSAQAKKIFSSMQGTLKDLVGEIHRSVGFFKSQADDLDVKRVVLLGDGAKLKNLSKFLKEQLRLKVSRVKELSDRFVLDDDVDVDTLEKHVMGFGVALGLAVQGAGVAPWGVDLAPPEVQIQRQLQNKLPFAIGAAVCAWLAFFLGHTRWSGIQGEIDGAKVHTSQLNTYKSLQSQAMELEDLSAYKTKAGRYTSLGDGRTLVLSFLDELRQVLPENNGVLPVWDHEHEAATPLLDQERKFEDLIRSEKVNEKKLWLLAMQIRQRREDLDQYPNRYAVELKVAKAVPINMMDDLAKVREQIDSEFRKPLQKRLDKEPFFVRAAIDQNNFRWGEITLGRYEEIWGLNPNFTAERGPLLDFTCVMIEIKFEIGVPKPPPEPEPGEGELDPNDPNAMGGG